MTRVLVCGGRHYGLLKPLTQDEAPAVTYHRAFWQWCRLVEVLDAAVERLGLTVLIEGAQTGADQLATRWALERGIKVVDFPADWDRYGRSAGPHRNRLMLTEGRPEYVIAFPGRWGTWNMVDEALKRHVIVHRIDPNLWP